MAVAEVRKFGTGECRAVGRKITGHAAIFDRASRNLGGFVEIVRPHAFDGALSERRQAVKARYNHADAFTLGSTDDGRLNIWPDSIGLAYEVEPGPEHQWLLRAVQRGDVTGSSFAFNMLGGGRDRWGLNEAGALMREVQEVGQLVDVAPVDSPAYPAAEASVRSLSGQQARLAMLERRRMPLDAETARRHLERKRCPPGADPREAQRVLERKWRPAG
jgi:hypothetical protein